MNRGEDYGTHTEDDARRWARAHGERRADDQQTRADLQEDAATASAAERFTASAGWCHVCGDPRTICLSCLGVHCTDPRCMPVGCADEVLRVQAEAARLWGGDQA